MKDKQQLLKYLLSPLLLIFQINHSDAAVQQAPANSGVQDTTAYKMIKNAEIIETQDGYTIQIVPDGTKIITTPNNSIIQIKPNGSDLIMKPDGTSILEFPDGSKIVRRPSENFPINDNAAKNNKKAEQSTFKEDEE